MKKLPEFIALSIGLGCLGLAGAIAAATITPPEGSVSLGAAEKAQPTAQHAAMVSTPGR